MKAVNALGRPVKWLWVMKKLNTPLSVSSYPLGTIKGAEVFGYPTPIRSTWYDRGDIYFDEEEIQLIRSFIRYKIEVDPKYPDRVAKAIFDLSSKIARHTISANSLTGQTLRQLVARLKREQELFLQMIGFMSYRGSIQMSDVLTERLRILLLYRLGLKGAVEEVDQYVDRVSLPVFESVVAEEKKAALKASIGWARLSAGERTRRLAWHRRTFDWMAYHWFVGHPRSDAELMKRFTRLSTSARPQLSAMKAEAERNERVIERIKRELGFSASERRLVRQFRTWLFLRTFVKDNINRAGYALLPLLHAIADRLGIHRRLIVYLTLGELHSLFHLSKSEIERRIHERTGGFSGGILNLRFQFGSLPGTVSTVETGEGEVLKGSVAYPGLVRGVVRVLHGPSEQGRFKRGEILVTSMTTPDLLPAMEKAAAFVTDEGGITSHAAIVAREMKKPCVIGTRTGTKLLQTGDRVEVDATRGVIRKVNQ